jgi:putative colanic acid biosynthesis UDP-glucose lipid carrier transferase
MKNCFDYVEQNRIEEIYSTILPDQSLQVEQLVLAAEQKCVRVKFVPDFSRQVDERFYISFVEDFPIITLRRDPLDQINNRFKKRLFDVIFSSLVIILILSWLTPILAILIKLESKGPYSLNKKDRAEIMNLSGVLSSAACVLIIIKRNCRQQKMIRVLHA